MGGDVIALRGVRVCGAGSFEHHMALLHVLLYVLWLKFCYLRGWECRPADRLYEEAPSQWVRVV